MPENRRITFSDTTSASVSSGSTSTSSTTISGATPDFSLDDETIEGLNIFSEKIRGTLEHARRMSRKSKFRSRSELEEYLLSRQNNLIQGEPVKSTFEILETYGIEIENDATIPRFSLPSGFSFTHDASIQTPVNAIRGGIKIAGEDQSLNKIFRPSQEIFGTEIASQQPLTLDDRDIARIKQVIDQIYLYGGNFESPRSGIHIHITVPRMLNFIKTTLKYFLHLEDVFYYLGGMGTEFRGISNDAIYCRPITGNGPQVIRCKSPKSFCQVFNVNDLLESKSLEQFQERYGNILATGYRGYPPVRYSWINYVTIFRQGSLEYRVFNTTLSSQLLKATINFCIELTKYLLAESLRPENKIKLSVNSIFSNPEKGDVINRFIQIAEVINLNNKYTEILIRGMEKTPRMVLDDSLVFSHLMYHRQGDKTNTSGYWRGFDYSPEPVDYKKVKKPTFVDVHNILSGRI